jgi:hypothetical protein
MSYTPPAHNAVDFVLSPGYTAPTHTLVNFDLGENIPASLVEGFDIVVASAHKFLAVSGAISENSDIVVAVAVAFPPTIAHVLESFDIVVAVAVAFPPTIAHVLESFDTVVAYAGVVFPDNSKYGRAGAAPNGSPIPKPTSMLMRSRDDGRLSEAWWKYINSFSQQPPGEIRVTLAKSPYAYKATRNGTLLVSGATVSAMTINSRNSGAVRLLGLTQGMIPVSIGDVVTITYAGAVPLVVFFPR